MKNEHDTARVSHWTWTTCGLVCGLLGIGAADIVSAAAPQTPLVSVAQDGAPLPPGVEPASAEKVRSPRPEETKAVAPQQAYDSAAKALAARSADVVKWAAAVKDAEDARASTAKKLGRAQRVEKHRQHDYSVAKREQQSTRSRHDPLTVLKREERGSGIGHGRLFVLRNAGDEPIEVAYRERRTKSIGSTFVEGSPGVQRRVMRGGDEFTYANCAVGVMEVQSFSVVSARWTDPAHRATAEAEVSRADAKVESALKAWRTATDARQGAEKVKRKAEVKLGSAQKALRSATKAKNQAQKVHDQRKRELDGANAQAREALRRAGTLATDPSPQ
jgi:hypothetical protein